MSAVTSAPTTRRSRAAAPLRVTQSRVLLSEWTKFRSLRSTVWTLLIAVVLCIGISALIAAVTSSSYDSMPADVKATFDATSTSLAGVMFSQLAVGVLGVLLITGEYSTGMIRSSLTVVPRRLPVLWAKIGVFAAVVLVVSLVSSFVSFFVGQALLSPHDLNVSLGDTHVLRSVIGSALYVTVAGLTGLGIGGLVRNTAAGISATVALFFVIPPLTGLLPSSWTDKFVQYLPSSAGEALWEPSQVSNALSPWVGFAVMCLWAAAFVAVAAVRLKRTDA